MEITTRINFNIYQRPYQRYVRISSDHLSPEKIARLVEIITAYSIQSVQSQRSGSSTATDSSYLVKDLHLRLKKESALFSFCDRESAEKGRFWLPAVPKEEGVIAS